MEHSDTDRGEYHAIIFFNKAKVGTWNLLVFFSQEFSEGRMAHKLQDIMHENQKESNTLKQWQGLPVLHLSSKRIS